MSGQSYGSVHHVAILATDLDESVGWHLTVLKAERESARRDAGANYPFCDQLATPRTTTGFMAATR
jgi:hypothetical protein